MAAITRMQQKRGTAAEWYAENPVLADGEIGFERDTGILKVGNGVDSWVELVPIVKGVLAPTQAEWEANNPVLKSGEVGIARDTNVIKVGDGVKTWTQLPSTPQSSFASKEYMDENFARKEFFKRLAAGAGAPTQGDIILLGEDAYSPANVGTSIVIGGAPNYENVVGGNVANVDTPTSNLTGAPTLTAPDGNWNIVDGGYDNVVNGWACAVTGYHVKVDQGANHVTVSGGSIHTVDPNAAYGTISGGTRNRVAGNNATVSGGSTNKATANQTTVAGGLTNEATAQSATVGGGTTNKATNNQATVAGGLTCTASGNSSTVGGGLTNSATATGATVPGGRDNTASGEYAVATGRGAVAPDHGQHAHGGGSFAVPGDCQSNMWTLRRETTNATMLALACAGGALPTIPENTTWIFSGLIVARRADVDGEVATWKVEGCLNRDAGSTAAFVGTPTVTPVAANAGNIWTLTVSRTTAGGLALNCTGEAGKTIRWVCRLESAQVSG